MTRAFACKKKWPRTLTASSRGARMTTLTELVQPRPCNLTFSDRRSKTVSLTAAFGGDRPLHGRAHVGGAFGHDDSGGFQGGDFFGRRSAAPRDDRAGMAHALARWGRAPGDERGHRLRD